MTQTLVADIEAFVAKSDARIMAVVKESLDAMTKDMQTPVAKGGRMRVKTGFLRASGRASLDGMPSGNGVRPDAGTFEWDGDAINAVLINMKLGDTFHFGWVANYAETREQYDGFCDTVIQNFQQYVNAASAQFKDK